MIIPYFQIQTKSRKKLLRKVNCFFFSRLPENLQQKSSANKSNKSNAGIIAVGDKDGGNNDCFRGTFRKIHCMYSLYRATCIRTGYFWLYPTISQLYPTDTSPAFTTEIAFNFKRNNSLKAFRNCYLHLDNNLSVIFAKIILLKHFYSLRMSQYK